MSDFSQGLMITLIGMLTIFGVLVLLVFASEVLKRVLGMSASNTHGQTGSANKSEETSFRIVVDDKEYSVDVKQEAVIVDGKYHTVAVRPEKLAPSESASKEGSPKTEVFTLPSSQANNILAPMSGKIRQIRTREGDRIQKGDVVLTIEVMKMEVEIYADRAGKVERILVEAGQTVTLNEALIVISS